jgi:hypothetical protein
MSFDQEILTRFVQLYVVIADMKARLKPINKEYKQLYGTILAMLLQQPNQLCTYDKYQLSVQNKCKKPLKNNTVISESYMEFQKVHGRDNVGQEECDAFIEFIKKYCDARKTEVPDIIITTPA